MHKRNRVYSYWFLQTRKRKVDIIGTTQFLHQIDKRLRGIADYIIWCKKITCEPEKKNYRFNDNGRLDDVYIILEPFDNHEQRPLKKRVFYANPFFSLYDTNEVVDPEMYEL